MAKFAMFRADNLAGTTQGKYLASIRMTADLENGAVVVPGSYETGAREVRACAAPAAGDAIGKIAILGSEEVVKEAKYNAVGGFTNKTGTVARGYILEAGDIFSVSAEGFETVPTVGAAVKVAAGKTKLGTTDAKDSGSSDITIGTCIAIEQDGATTWYVVRV